MRRKRQPQQLQLLRIPEPTHAQIREEVEARLYGFKSRQAARQAKREKVKARAKGAAS